MNVTFGLGGTERPIALIETSRGSDWGSCLTIMPNLASAYQIAAGSRLKSIDYGKHSTSVEILRAAEKILALNPSHAVFIDHQKHPYDLLVALDFVFGRKKWPALIFHVYGDFTLYTPRWARSEKLLRGKEVHFVCASPRQRKLVSTFVPNASTSTSVCPFPISRDEFSWREGLRESERLARSYSDDEYIMVYTGRLSLQKNILKMISDIVSASTNLKKPWRLILAGTFDDIGDPFFGVQLGAGGYYEGYKKLIERLDPEIASKIEYIGALGKPELLRLYHAADLFVSFSTHHDEDYGMSPIEALCCGTKALITNWGGFNAFALDPQSARLIPVSINGQGAGVQATHVDLILSEMMQPEEDDVQTEASREQRSETYLNAFSIQAASDLIAKLLESKIPKFNVFKPFLKRHAKLRRSSEAGEPMFRFGAKSDANYLKTYENYIAEARPRR